MLQRARVAKGLGCHGLVQPCCAAIATEVTKLTQYLRCATPKRVLSYAAGDRKELSAITRDCTNPMEPEIGLN